MSTDGKITGPIIDPRYLAKFTERQQIFLATGVGRKFQREYLGRKGNHTYIIGNTGSGKTWKGYWLVDYLCKAENIVWFSTGKSNEILPLFFMGCKVRIVIPKGAEFRIKGIEKLPEPPEIIQVESPAEAWWAVLHPPYNEQGNKTFNQITIFEFRNTLSPSVRYKWLSDLFQYLAEWSRKGTMPKIFPCAFFIDESQWVLAGSRISDSDERNRAAKLITENVLEIRSKGGRVIFFAQDFKNVTPASRENMLNAILCRGANVPSDENRAWASACNDAYRGLKPTSYFKRNEGRFVFDDGDFFPVKQPWEFEGFPRDPEHRKLMESMDIIYGEEFAGITEEKEEEQEIIPDLGLFSPLAMKPDVVEEIVSRWNAEEVMSHDG